MARCDICGEPAAVRTEYGAYCLGFECGDNAISNEIDGLYGAEYTRVRSDGWTDLETPDAISDSGDTDG